MRLEGGLEGGDGQWLTGRDGFILLGVPFVRFSSRRFSCTCWRRHVPRWLSELMCSPSRGELLRQKLRRQVFAFLLHFQDMVIMKRLKNIIRLVSDYVKNTILIYMIYKLGLCANYCANFQLFSAKECNYSVHYFHVQHVFGMQCYIYRISRNLLPGIQGRRAAS